MSIQTSTRCSCGGPVVLLELPTFALPNRWQAHCDLCLDPTEDAGRLAHVVGYGATPDEALWSWQDDHDEAWADRICWTVAPTVVEEVLAQAAQEFARPMDLIPGWLTARQAAELGLPGKQIDVVYYEPRARPAYPIAGGVR